MAPTRRGCCCCREDKRIQMSSNDRANGTQMASKTETGNGRRRPARGNAILILASIVICSLPLARSQTQRHLGGGSDRGIVGGGDCGGLFESFMDEQVAVVSPLHLGWDLQPQSDNLAEHMDRLAHRVVMGAEAPDGGRLRASLIESLQLDQLLLTGAGYDDDEDEGGDNHQGDHDHHQQAQAAAMEAEHERRRKLCERQLSRARGQFRWATRMLRSNVADGQLRSMLDVFDFDSFDTNIRITSPRPPPEGSEHDRRREAKRLREWQLKRAELVESVNDTFNQLPRDEQVRFALATMEAYGPAQDDQVNRKQVVSLRRDRRSTLKSVGGRIALAPRFLLRLVGRVVEIGLELFDRLSITSEYLLAVPVLGDKVREMRAKGETLINIVQEIRRVHYLFKVSHCPKSLSASDPKYCTSDEQQQQAAGSDPPASTQLAPVASDMIGPHGISDLKELALYLMRDLKIHEAINMEKVREITSRILYALMAWALTSATAHTHPVANQRPPPAAAAPARA